MVKVVIDVNDVMKYADLNEHIRQSADREIILNGCMGQRYIATALKDKHIVVNGTPGNALGAYLDGATVVVNGNAQDATGDTMNGGNIIIHGNAGDTTGYSMRGGKIYISGNAGYRTGIHMKEYSTHKPIIVIGGRVGSFLGEYQAGGVIVVLGTHKDGLPVINNFTGTGMHGGVMYIRCEKLPKAVPEQVCVSQKYGSEIPELCQIIKDYCTYFSQFDERELLNGKYAVLTANASNPYKQMYTPD